VKTISLKKVAVVSVASLGFGLLSVVPAKAAVLPNGTATAITLSSVTTSPVVGTAVHLKMGTTLAALTATTTADTLTFQSAVTSFPAGGSVATVGVLPANQTPAGTATDITTTASTAAVTVVAGGNIRVTTTGTTAWSAQTLTYLGGFSFTPTKAGAHVVTVWVDTDVDGQLDPTEVSQTVSVTVAAAADLAASTSTVFMRGDNTATAADATTDAIPAVATATAGTANSAAITISLKDSANVAMASGNTVSATLTGPGYIRWSTADAPTASQCSATPTYAATLGRSITAQTADAVGTLYVCADGISGVSTVVITAANAAGVSQTLATKTVTFYGAVTKIVATGVLTVGRAGRYAVGVDTANRNAATVVPSVIIKATDKNGVGVGGLTGGITAVSSDATVMTSTVTNNPDTAGATYSSGGLGFYNVATNTATSSKSGGKATLTFRVVDPAGDGTTYLTSTVDFTIGGSVATETLSFDKATYAPGESMIVTITAKDSSGNPVYDGAASPAVTFSKSVGGTAPAASTYVGGKKSNSANTLFAPAIPGAFQALATSGNAAGSALTASATVSDANAALMTQIDALNAKIVALNALIAKIMKKLGVK